jgi:hypothetical protein
MDVPMKTSTTPRPASTLDIQELCKILLKSEKFLNWRPKPSKWDEPDDGRPLKAEELNSAISVDDKHFTPAELAEGWGVSIDLIRRMFRDEPGVLKIGDKNPKHKRQYLTLRIPGEVAERVHKRLAT